ncbi:hypothetical protein M440DRAFT_1265900 [Trichoderma longibrachiatum ATCC 18648]|uniref:Uncharacterized protein n=1 Tax=Trichoderma longibrachiatum ATCC 18648 TaxID=983965 RepID=A0A2T4C353_TRILO|nr:hypothetical protein M440DRAFT_1265900 [Trichoderma longibrachiatum ATCC 18648]
MRASDVSHYTISDVFVESPHATSACKPYSRDAKRQRKTPVNLVRQQEHRKTCSRSRTWRPIDRQSLLGHASRPSNMFHGESSATTYYIDEGDAIGSLHKV